MKNQTTALLGCLSLVGAAQAAPDRSNVRLQHGGVEVARPALKAPAAVAPDRIRYRGFKQFLLLKPAGAPASVLLGRPYGSKTHTLVATLQRVRSVYDLTGVGPTHRLELGHQGPAGSLALAAEAAGLFKLRVIQRLPHRPTKNSDITWSVDWSGFTRATLDMREPSFTFYAAKIRSTDYGRLAVRQFFYAPAGVGPFRVKLMTEKGAERAHLRLFRIDGEALVPAGELRVHGSHRDPEGRPAHYAELRVEPPKAGWLSCFTLPQVAANTWVRFSPNVPPFVAHDPGALLLPAIHLDLPRVSYADRPARLRALACAPGASVRLVVDGRVRPDSISLPGGESATVQVRARLLDAAGRTLSETPVRRCHRVRRPRAAGWPRRLDLIYDDGNGRDAAALRAAGFDVVQTDSPATLSTIAAGSMKAWAALYGNPAMLRLFRKRSRRPPAGVLMWGLYDEPDRMVNDHFDRSRELTLDLLAARYAEAASRTDLPLSLNVSMPICFEEYAPSCDVLITDPFGSLFKVRDWVAAGAPLTRAAGKRFLVCLWGRAGWFTSPAEYRRRHAWLRTQVEAGRLEGIATYKYATGGKKIFELDHTCRKERPGCASYTGAALWEAIVGSTRR